MRNVNRIAVTVVCLLMSFAEGTEVFNCSGKAHGHCCSELGCVWCAPSESCIRCASKGCLRAGPDNLVVLQDICPEPIIGNILNCKDSEEATMNGEVILFMIFSFVLINILLLVYKKCTSSKSVKYSHMT
eukprot:TRINITY_DN23434_c0_g1_i1.p1 TRINITY_DN23434_c0_g1~~TRINITY_DN23434_c0_g1_i1.p1  ORF type:complete len:130 (+),score=9.10 TRINITY_DN23434_c0_g1_i1:65-454(+)